MYVWCVCVCVEDCTQGSNSIENRLHTPLTLVFYSYNIVMFEQPIVDLALPDQEEMRLYAAPHVLRAAQEK